MLEMSCPHLAQETVPMQACHMPGVVQDTHAMCVVIGVNTNLDISCPGGRQKCIQQFINYKL